MSQNRIITQETEALYDAAEQGDIKSVRELVQNPQTDVNYHRQVAYGKTPLLIAIANGYADIVVALIENGADMHELKTPDLNNPLHEACFHRNASILRILVRAIEEKASEDEHYSGLAIINAKNQFGNTPLHTAAIAGSLECIVVLVDAGANINARNTQLATPLHHACYCHSNNTPVVEYFIQNKANVNVTDKNNSTPLIIAAKKNQLGAIQALLNAKADCTMRDDSGRDAIASAILRENNQAAEMIQDMLSSPRIDPKSYDLNNTLLPEETKDVV